MTAKSYAKVEVEFSCSHKRLFTEPYPSLGDQLWCPQCGRMKEVVDHPDKFSMRCMTGNCDYKRAGKASLNAAIGFSRTHVKNSYGKRHVVNIYFNKELKYIVGPYDQESEAANGAALRETSREQQAVLRRVTAGVTQSNQKSLPESS